MRPLLGPLPEFQSRWPLALVLILAVLVLTVVTQVGGLVLWLSWPMLEAVGRRSRTRGRGAAALAAIAAYLLLYGGVSLAVVPPLASAYGRDRLPCIADAEQPYEAVSPLVCLTNRNYAKPAVHTLMRDLSMAMAGQAPGTVTAYLDAGFPFFDGFPMLPHLSHRTGRDIDLAFYYRNRDNGSPVSKGGAWLVGYWAYERPRPGDSRPCPARIADLRWDLDWLQPAFDDLVIDEQRTGAMLRWLSAGAERYGVRKILLEPHLQRRLGTDGRIVRFQGCRAARHDDHLHVQTR